MIPIHNHSEFSALDGYSKSTEIAERCTKIGVPGAFLTDHGVVSGWRSFEKEMKKRDLYAGFGVEAYQSGLASRKLRPEGKNVRDASHVILLAKNLTGAKNIMALTDAANRTGFYYHPRVDWELLKAHSDGVVCTSACALGLVSKGIVKEQADEVVGQYLRIFGDDFFLELSTYDPDQEFDAQGTTQRVLNEAICDLAHEYGVPLVYANDAHYSKKSDHLFHEVLLCMQMAKSLDDPNRISHPPCLYIMDEKDVRSRLSYLPESVVDEAVKNSDTIMERCLVDFGEPKMHLPVFVPQDHIKESNNAKIIRLTEEGCGRLYGTPIPEAVEDRAFMELEVIIKAGLVDYFLITEDFCRFADHEGIGRGPGRGSAGGSLVAFALGITDVDPLRYGLYFERFYNAGRDKGLPDIDIDFEKSRRTEIDAYLMKRYGAYNVLSIGTHIRLKPKATIEKLARPLYGEDANYPDIKRIKKIIEEIPDIEILTGDLIGWHSGPGIVVSVLDDPVAAEKLKPYIEKYPELFLCAENIGGRISTYGVHASAVIISDVDLRGEIPAMMRTPRDDDGQKSTRVIASQIEMKEVESSGYPKFDRLGLRTIDTLELVRRMVDEPFSYKDIDWENQPEEMWELLDKGRTLGLFQVEEGNAKRIAKQLRPRTILDLAAIIALNRPGPLRTGVADRYIKRRAGDEATVYRHPILEDILHESYGDFLYQEQVIAYFRKIGYNLHEADGIRSMLGKKKVAEMDAEFPRYLARATEHMDGSDAKRIWLDIADFSKYSFNKSHAVCYALILARTVWAKWKYPMEWTMACIKTNSALAGEYVAEGKRLGVDINPPDINMSQPYIDNKDGQIWYGLCDVKNVGVQAAQWIVDHRPYRSYSHLLSILDAETDEWKREDKDTREVRSPRQTCTSGALKSLQNAGAFDTLEDRDVSDRQKITLQQDYLGVVLLDQNTEAIALNKDRIESVGSMEDLDAPENFQELLTFPAVVNTVRYIETKNGNTMAFVKLDWEADECEVSIAPRILKPFQWLMEPGTLAIWQVRRTEWGNSFESAEKLV